MKRIYVILLVALLPSCVALKPDSTKLSAPDYNKRVEVTGAHYDKVLTPIGYSSIVASTLAGGYYGYKSDLIQYYSDTERKSLHAGGALIGAATGFTVSYLLNKAFGWGQVVQVTDPNKWVEKANKNFINLGGETSKFELVHKTAHENWAVRKFKDIDDFTKAFPGSNKTNDVFWSGSQVFERNQLPSLVKLNPTNPYNIKIKYRYLNLSNSTNECIEAKNLYSELSDSAEISSIKRIASVSDALAVEKNWPNTKYPKLLGEKYFSHAQSTAEFIDISNKYNFLDSKCEVKAVEGIETFSDIELYNNKWSKTNVGLLVESKAIQVCSRDELKLFINLFPKGFTISAKKEYIASAPSYREFIRTAWIEYPDLINLPQTFDETDLANVKEHYKNLLNNESFFKSEQLSSLRNNLLDISLNSIYSKAKDNNDTLLLLADILDEEEWLHARNRENGTKDYIDIVTERIKYNLRIEEFIKIQVDGEIEDKMNFCLKYPSTPEAESFTNELNKFVNNYVQITDVTHWSAKGNSSWLNDLAETSRDFIHGGQAYNFFIMGLLKNYADIPVKITLRVDLMRYKTCGVSIFQSTSEEIITDKNHLVIPPKESMPFLMVFKDLSEGTVVGSGLLSAGCTYSPLDIKTISKTLYNGEISRKQMLNHIAFVKDIVNKGNVSRTLSPNERAEQWVNEKFGMEPTRKTTLRIKNASGGGLTVYSIKGGSKNEISKNREIDKEDYEDFDLYGGTYKVLTSLGEVSVDIKGRMTHLIVEKKKFRVSYDDID